MDSKPQRTWWTGGETSVKRVVRSSLAGETHAHVETLGMLELAKLLLFAPGHLEKHE